MYHLLGLPRSLPVLFPLVIPMQMPQELAPWGYSGLPGATFLSTGPVQTPPRRCLGLRVRRIPSTHCLGATWRYVELLLSTGNPDRAGPLRTKQWGYHIQV